MSGGAGSRNEGVGSGSEGVRGWRLGMGVVCSFPVQRQAEAHCLLLPTVMQFPPVHTRLPVPVHQSLLLG